MKAVLVVIILETFVMPRQAKRVEYPSLEACQETLRVMKTVPDYTVAYCEPTP